MSGYLGVNISNIVPPSQAEQEATAGKEEQKVQMNMVPDTLQISFTELDEDAKWQYQAEREPNLDKPLEHTRIAHSGTKPASDEGSRAQHDKLVNDLDPDIKAALLKNREKPKGQKNASLNSLDNVLAAMAQQMSGVTAAKGDSMFVADFGFNNFIQQGSETFGQIKEQLEDIGHQDPQFNDASHHLGTAMSALRNLGKAGG